ncbi:cysteine-rich repeat secretory protein 55-like [Oryza brachyantha]|uniref:cysteine-rich repeat secretory protein 55-like n=1 Tax=Oryza brachyantha TaxID=4533 RepID=UPI001AD9B952|nr:cysteine-rich repeat secretory protein 55-like [Oryza brachyantha]
MASSRSAYGSMAVLAAVVFSLALLAMAASTTTYPIGGFCYESTYGEISDSNFIARRRSVNSLLSGLTAKARSNAGFATSSAGRGDAVFYGLAQCRGDVSAGDCDACLAAAAKQIVSYCGNYTSDARLWYDYCFMRYYEYNFVGEVDTRADASLAMRTSSEEMDNPKAFQRAAGKAMGKAKAQAVAAGNAGLGRAKEQYAAFVSVYALAQCTRDLAPPACAQCLSTATSKLGQLCGGAQGCRIDYSSCWVRYEIYPFYFPLAAGAGRAAATDMTKYTKITVH